MTQQSINNPDLRIIVEKTIELVTSHFDTKRIYLFGKYARLKRFPRNGPSEIDIIVIAITDLKFRDRIKLIRDNDKSYPPLNPLIYTEGEVLDLLENGEGFLEDALEESILIWETEKQLLY